MNLALILIAVLALTLVFFEFRFILREAKTRALEGAWPQFEETYLSALQSGISISDSFSFANDFELPQLSKYLRGLVTNVDRGVPLATAIVRFREQVALPQADLFTRIVVLAHQTGGQNLVQSLTEHVNGVRGELAALGDVRARQSAILSVAKLGLLAPWILVAVLSFNEQTRLAFNTVSGNLVLIAGFAVSFLAYRLVVSAGRLPTFSRFLGA